MAEKNRRTYPEAFKLEALALLESSSKSAGQIEEDLGITRGLLLKWQTRYQAVAQANGEVHLETSELAAAQAEIRRLQQKLAEVEVERDILKKTVHIFSRSST
jgi:transposase